MSLIAELQGQRRNKKLESMEIAAQIGRRVNDIRRLLANPTMEIADMQLDLVQQLAEEAVSMKAKYIKILADIAVLDGEIGA